jgi:hypothetical protein
MPKPTKPPASADERSAVKVLLDRVDWQPVPQEIQRPIDMPHVTHEGILKIAGLTLRVYQLSDGQRVIDANEIRSLLGLDEQDPDSPLWGEQAKQP